MLVFESTAKLLGLQRKPTMYSPETQSRMATLRSKCADGSIQPEELREAIKLMRDGRLSTVTASAASKQKKSKAPVNVADIFADLDKL